MLIYHNNDNVFYAAERTSAKFKFQETTTKQVAHLIKNIKNTNASGHDGLNVQILKKKCRRTVRLYSNHY